MKTKKLILFIVNLGISVFIFQPCQASEKEELNNKDNNSAIKQYTEDMFKEAEKEFNEDINRKYEATKNLSMEELIEKLFRTNNEKTQQNKNDNNSPTLKKNNH